MLVDDSQLDMSLMVAPEIGFVKVRCIDLETNGPASALANLLSEYPFDGDESEPESEGEKEGADAPPGDEVGIELPSVDDAPGEDPPADSGHGGAGSGESDSDGSPEPPVHDGPEILCWMKVAGAELKAGGAKTRLKRFRESESFRLLEASNVAMWPDVEGCSVSRHPSSHQWSGQYPGLPHGKSPSWKPGLRTEIQALLPLSQIGAP